MAWFRTKGGQCRISGPYAPPLESTTDPPRGRLTNRPRDTAMQPAEKEEVSRLVDAIGRLHTAVMGLATACQSGQYDVHKAGRVQRRLWVLMGKAADRLHEILPPAPTEPGDQPPKWR